jgi:hypothetical protein
MAYYWVDGDADEFEKTWLVCHDYAATPIGNPSVTGGEGADGKPGLGQEDRMNGMILKILSCPPRVPRGTSAGGHSSALSVFSAVIPSQD